MNNLNKKYKVKNKVFNLQTMINKINNLKK